MRLPQLFIRDLFWLVLVVGMGLAWLVDRTIQAQRAAHWRTEAVKVMGWVDRNCSWVDVGLTDDDEILILREATPEERAELLNRP